MFHFGSKNMSYVEKKIYIYGHVQKLLSQKVNFSDHLLVGLACLQNTLNGGLTSGRGWSSKVHFSKGKCLRQRACRIRKYWKLEWMPWDSPRTLRGLCATLRGPHCTQDPGGHICLFRNINFTAEIARLGCKRDSKSKGFLNLRFPECWFLPWNCKVVFVKV